MYYMAQSCLHIVINYLWLPEPDQNMYAVFVSLSQASTEFCKIAQKYTNSTENGKFRSSAQNSVLHGKLWSPVVINIVN